jgi:MFS family permease
MESPPSDRILPLIVATALFMENMDSTVISTSLPAIALALGTNPLTLKLAVTSYLLSLAICIPASGWTADRFGTRNVFRAAIGVFVLGSIGCAASHSLQEFVLARIVQGAGGAMMTPVGRLIMVRSIDKRLLVNAMSLVTIPALIGPICGPPLGGFITTYASWHWIFLINVPIGLVGIVLASRFIPNIRVERPDPFDCVGFLLSGCAIAGLAFGLSAMGLDFFPTSIVASLLCGGANSRSQPVPVSDLSRQYFRRVFVSARHRRAAVSTAAAPPDRLSSHAVSIGPHHLYHRARFDVHEGRSRKRAASLRLP